MNSSYEVVPLASRPASRHASGITAYVPLEYREAGEPNLPEEDCTDPSAENGGDAPPAEPLPDPAAVLEARLEQERRAIRAQAHQEAEREIQRARTAIAGAIQQFAQQRDEYFHQAESEIVGLTLAIARRILHRESQIDPGLLTGLVRHELEQLDAATSVRLFVSPDTLSAWNETVRAIPHPVELLADKTLGPGDARLETALGSTTVSFERELKEIERGFFDLLSRRPPAVGTKGGRVQ
ncbi:MAG: FliH/SctL family protein [Candidatus Korobacteraceae bacterium]